jgi:hypothetical protein
VATLNQYSINVSGRRTWLNFETEFLSGDLTWPFQKKSQICPDLLLALFKKISKSVRIGIRAHLPLPGVLINLILNTENSEPVIVDIGPPPHGYLTPFNIYVALSRGTGRQHIQLLRDFDRTLLEQHPCEYLRLEDDRLKKLNEWTRQIWESLAHI